MSKFKNPHFKMIILWLLISSIGGAGTYFVWVFRFDLNLLMVDWLLSGVGIIILLTGLVLAFKQIFQAVRLLIIMKREEVMALWVYKTSNWIYFSSLKKYFRTNLPGPLLRLGRYFMAPIIIGAIFLSIYNPDYQDLVSRFLPFVGICFAALVLLPIILRKLKRFLKYPITALFTTNGVFFRNHFYNFISSNLAIKKVIATAGVQESVLFAYTDSARGDNSQLKLKVPVAEDQSEIAEILADYYGNKISLSQFRQMEQVLEEEAIQNEIEGERIHREEEGIEDEE